MSSNRKTGGRKAGVPNKVTSIHREHLSTFLSESAGPEQLRELWDDLKPAERATLLPKLLGYVIPKMETHEINGEMSPEYAREILNSFIQ